MNQTVRCKLIRRTRQALCAALAASALSTCSRPSVIADVPVDLVTNLMIVEGRINGSEPLSFIVDTGASASVMHRARAEQLRLPLRGKEEATTGGGTVEAVQIQGASLSIGEAMLPNLPLVAIDLTALQAGLGAPIDGIVGFDLFEHFVVDMDYKARRLRLHDPQRWVGSVGDVLPIELEEQIPFVRVGLTSQKGAPADARLELDTGQTGSLTLTQPFVDVNRLLGVDQPTLTISTGAILAGQVPARLARLGSVRLGSTTIASPIANITPDATGAATATGILGGEVLRRFHVVIDYPRKRIVLTPNDDVNAHFEFDATGMSLASTVTEPLAFRVRTVISESPASEAGVMAGDLITAVENRPAGELRLTELRERFRVPDTATRLTVTRDGIARQVTIRSRRLI